MLGVCSGAAAGDEAIFRFAMTAFRGCINLKENSVIGLTYVKCLNITSGEITEADLPEQSDF